MRAQQQQLQYLSVDSIPKPHASPQAQITLVNPPTAAAVVGSLQNLSNKQSQSSFVMEPAAKDFVKQKPLVGHQNASNKPPLDVQAASKAQLTDKLMRKTIKDLLIKVKSGSDEISTTQHINPMPKSRQGISGWNDAMSYAKKSFQSYVGGEHSNREAMEEEER